MNIPPEIALLIPLALPFIIGLLIGVIVKRALKLIVAVVALVIVLVAVGYLNLTFQDSLSQALQILPKLINTGQWLLDVLPYSTATFLIGLALGLWKG